MSYIEIDKKPVIFDDPEFCEGKFKTCIYCDYDYSKCHLFIEKLLWNEKAGFSIKCQECKAAWKIAKEGKAVPA